MSSLPLISTSHRHVDHAIRGEPPSASSSSSLLPTADASRVARHFLEELSHSLRRARPRALSVQQYPFEIDRLRLIERSELPSSVSSRAWQAELRALRSADPEHFHVDDVHVVLPVRGTILTAGKDGRAVASAIQGDQIVAQPIHPLRESPILFHGEVDHDHHPVVSEHAWVTAGASLNSHFAMGRRDGTIFRGEVTVDENGERCIRRRWNYAAGAGKPGNWSVMPESPRLVERQGVVEEDPNSRRVYGLALLPGPEGSPPALTAACGKVLWSTSSQGGKPTVTPLSHLLQAQDPLFPERILGLQGLPQASGDTLSSLFVLSQEQALWIRTQSTANPLELALGATLEFESRHLSAHWLADGSGVLGALGQARTGRLSVVHWTSDGGAVQEEWRGNPSDDQIGTAWAIDHFSPDLIVSGHQNAIVRLWDVRTGSPELDLHLPFGRASGLAADRDQMQLIACAADDRCYADGRGGTSMLVWDLRQTTSSLDHSSPEVPDMASGEGFFDMDT